MTPFVDTFMPTEGDVDTSRTSVKTYVPAYQKTKWKAHADELGMSQSEFVRSMVQAGRRGFGGSDDGVSTTNPRGSSAENTHSNGSATSGGSSDELADRVVALLERERTLSWDELVEELTADIEDRLDDALADLQDQRRVRYSGRNGGYTLSDRR